MSFYQGRRTLPQRFRLVLVSVLQTAGLPFADAFGEQEVQDAFDQHNVAFAQDDDVHTSAVALWAFLSQILHKGEQRSCLTVVSRVIVLLVALGRKSCAKNSGAYCRARAKLSEVVIEHLTLEVADGLRALIIDLARDRWKIMVVFRSGQKEMARRRIIFGFGSQLLFAVFDLVAVSS